MASTSLTFDLLANDRASAKFDRVGSAASRAGGHLSSLGAKFKSMAKFGALAAVAAAGLAAKLGVDAVKAAAEDEQSQKKLALALRNSTGASKEQIATVEKLIDATSRQFGVADDELRPAMQRLTESTGSVKKGYDQLRLAMDVAAGTGKPLKTVTEALTKANNGSTGGLSRLGVKMKDAAGNTLTLNQAMKQMADTFGGQAAQKADTFQGRMDRLKVVFNETKEAIGYKLLPVLSSMADWFLAKGIPAISQIWGWLKNKLGPVFAEVGDFVRDRLLPALGQFKDDAGPGVRDAMNAVKDAFKSARPFLQDVGNFVIDTLIPVMGDLARNVLPLVADHIRRVGKAFAVIGNVIKWTWNNVIQPQMKMFAMAIANMLDMWGTMLGALSHVPGFGWAKDAADKLHHAADETRGFADALKKIPPHVSTTITTTYVSRGGPGGQGGGGGLGPAPSGGTGNPAGKTSGNRNGKASWDGMEIRVTGIQDPAAKAFIHTGGSSRY